MADPALPPIDILEAPQTSALPPLDILQKTPTTPATAPVAPVALPPIDILPPVPEYLAPVEKSFYHKFNTELTPDEERRFGEWATYYSKKIGRNILDDLGTYDVKGAWKARDIPEPGQHGTDKWKKPSHPTFSDESIYHGAEGFRGGHWGKNKFTPGTTSLYKPEELKSYFQKVEPSIEVDFYGQELEKKYPGKAERFLKTYGTVEPGTLRQRTIPEKIVSETRNVARRVGAQLKGTYEAAMPPPIRAGLMTGLLGTPPPDDPEVTDHPVFYGIATTIGTIAGLEATGGLLKKIGFVRRLPATLLARFGIENSSKARIAAQMIKQGMDFGGLELAQKGAKLVRGEGLTEDDAFDILKSTGMGAVMGLGGAPAKFRNRLLANNAIAFGLSKLQGADNQQTAINMAAFTIFSLANTEDFSKLDKEVISKTLLNELDSKIVDMKNRGIPDWRTVAYYRDVTFPKTVAKVSGETDYQKGFGKITGNKKLAKQFIVELEQAIKVMRPAKGEIAPRTTTEKIPIQPATTLPTQPIVAKEPVVPTMGVEIAPPAPLLPRTEATGRPPVQRVAPLVTPAPVILPPVEPQAISTPISAPAMPSQAAAKGVTGQPAETVRPKTEGEIPATEVTPTPLQTKVVWNRDIASPIANAVNGSVVGSVKTTGESAHDLDVHVPDYEDKLVTQKLQERGFVFNGSQLVSPKEAKASGKIYGEGWQQVEYFRDGNGNVVNVWHDYTEPVLVGEVTPAKPSEPTLITEGRPTVALPPAQRSWRTGAERPFAFDPNSTTNEGRFRLRPVEDFAQGTFRRRKGGMPGVSYIIGKDTVTGKTEVQAIRFDKGIFTEERAGKWYVDNAQRLGRQPAVLPAPKTPVAVTVPTDQIIGRLHDLAKKLGVRVNKVEYRNEQRYLDPENPRERRLLREEYTDKEIDDAIANGDKFVIAGEHKLSHQAGKSVGSDITLFQGYDERDVAEEFSHAIEEQGGIPGWVGTKEQHAKYIAGEVMAGRESRIAELTPEGKRIWTPTDRIGRTFQHSTKRVPSTATAEHTHIDRKRVAELGYTTDVREAGYITPEGKLIDLSGKKEGGTPHERPLDHREVGGTIGMQEFMAEGNVRIDLSSGLIDLYKAPTKKQEIMIEQLLESYSDPSLKLYRGLNYIPVDFQNGLGELSAEGTHYTEASDSKHEVYPPGTSPRKIINDIRAFYRGEKPVETMLLRSVKRTSKVGELPEAREIPEEELPSKSVSSMDADYMKAVKSGDEETAQNMVDEAAKKAGYTVGPVYHGSTATEPFSVFSTRRNRGANRMGAYFTENKSFAQRPHGFDVKNVYGTMLNIEKPFDLRGMSRDQVIEALSWMGQDIKRDLEVQGRAGQYAVLEWADKKHNLVPLLKRRGYDGMVFENPTEGRTWVAFRPTQIKSADAITRDDKGNVIPLSQRFQPEEPDIRYSIKRVPQESPSDQERQKENDKILKAAQEKSPEQLRSEARKLGLDEEGTVKDLIERTTGVSLFRRKIPTTEPSVRRALAQEFQRGATTGVLYTKSELTKKFAKIADKLKAKTTNLQEQMQLRKELRKELADYAYANLDSVGRNEFNSAVWNVFTPEQRDVAIERLNTIERRAIARRYVETGQIKGDLDLFEDGVLPDDVVRKRATVIQSQQARIEREGRADKKRMIGRMRKLVRGAMRSTGVQPEMKKALPTLLKDVESNLQNLSPSQVRSMLATVRETIAQGREMRLLDKATAQIRKDIIERELLEQDDVNKLDSKEDVERAFGEKLPISDAMWNEIAPRVRWLQRSLIGLQPVDVFFDTADGGKAGLGEVTRLIKQPLDSAWGLHMQWAEQIKEKLGEVALRYDMNDDNARKITVTTFLRQYKDGDEGVSEFINGDITMDELAERNTGIRDLRESESVSDKDLTAILKQPVTEGEQKWISAFDEFSASIREQMKAFASKEYGFLLEEKPGYFPWRRVFGNQTSKAAKDMPSVSELMFADKGYVKSGDKFIPSTEPKHGMIMKRTGSKLPIEMNAFKVAQEFIDDATYMLALDGKIRELAAVIERPSIADKYGTLFQDTTLRYLDMMSKTGGSMNHLASVNWLIKNLSHAQLVGRLSTWMIQATAIGDGAGRIGGYWVANGITEYDQNAEAWRAFAKEHLPELWFRKGMDDPALAVFNTESNKDKFSRWVSAHTNQMVDNYAASVVTVGAYLKALHELGIPYKSGDPIPYNEEAVTKAQQDLRISQASPYMKDLPLAVSTGTGWLNNPSLNKALFQWQTFPLNRWWHMYHWAFKYGMKGGFKDKVKMAGTLNWVIAAILAEELGRHGLQELWHWIFGKKDKQSEGTELAVAALKGMADSIPVVGQFERAVTYDKVGVPIIDLMYKIPSGTAKLVLGKKAKTKVKGGIDVLEALATINGIPMTGQMASIARDASNLIGENKEVPEGQNQEGQEVEVRQPREKRTQREKRQRRY